MVVLAAKKKMQIDATLCCPETKTLLNLLVRSGYLGYGLSSQIAKCRKVCNKAFFIDRKTNKNQAAAVAAVLNTFISL